MDLTPGATLALGFALGASHALEPDHVAAVSTLVSEQRRLTMSCLLGACWGLGHTIALMAAGVAVLVFRVAIPPGLERGLEMSVALLSIGLGLRALGRLAAGVSVHRHTHAHGGRAHTHYHVHLRPARQRHRHRWPRDLRDVRLRDLRFRDVDGDAHDGLEHLHLAAVGGRPAMVGLLHGLAGSAALILGALGALGSPALGLAYILTFGIGSTAGMLALSGMIGLPFAGVSAALAAPRAEIALAALRALAALASIAVGVALASRLGG